MYYLLYIGESNCSLWYVSNLTLDVKNWKKKKNYVFSGLLEWAWGSLRQSYSTLRVLIGKQRMQIDTLVSSLSEFWLLSRWQASTCGLKPKVTRWLLEVRLSEVIKHTWAKRDSCKNNFLQNFAVETIVRQLRQPKQHFKRLYSVCMTFLVCLLKGNSSLFINRGSYLCN